MIAKHLEGLVMGYPFSDNLDDAPENFGQLHRNIGRERGMPYPNLNSA